MTTQPSAGANRRQFIKESGAVALAANLGALGAVHASSPGTIKVGLVGCGGRGQGAMIDALNADPRVRITALADVFDQGEKGVHTAFGRLESQGQKIEKDRVFVGFDAYKKLLALDLDYVILATPPHFRPDHIAAAVEAGKHVFTEKPVAVDPPGARKVMEAGELARTKKLSIAAGTQRRHQAPYLENYQRIRDGAIGPIVAARCYWNSNQLWYRHREDAKYPQYKTCSDMELMIRDWVNWSWLSGDHICEQHVHNLDVINWFLSKDGTAEHPTRAVGMGGRARRVTGDQFDFFSIDFEYPGSVHVSSYCRQVNGCDGNISEAIVGEQGTSTGAGRITGPKAWSWNSRDKYLNPYVQEHKDLVASITGQGPYLNEARNVATSTLTAIMGRTAAYTGRPVTWEEMMASNLRLGPKEYDWDIALFPQQPPVPGRA